MFNKKKTSTDREGGMGTGREIINGLENQDVNVFVRIGGNNERGAGRRVNPSHHQSQIAPGKSLYMDDYFKDNAPADFKMIFRFDGMPSKDGVEGMKVIPGMAYRISDKKMGVPHHTEYIDRSDGKYEAIIHYKLQDVDEAELPVKSYSNFVDVDPTVTHPEWP